MSKHAYLKEMGIDVWVERNASVLDVKNSDVQITDIPIAKVLDQSTSNITTHKVLSTSELEIANLIVEKVDIASLDWPRLQLEVSKCQSCHLSQSRTHTLFGEGDKSASLMIIAADSNEQSSELLTSMLKAMGYQRNHVYISNIIKCNVAETSEVSEDEYGSCEPYLLRQIDLIQPKLILVLGNATAQRLLKTKSTMNRMRGQLHYIDGISSPILVSYHPTYLLAAPNEKRKAWDDLQIAMKELIL